MFTDDNDDDAMISEFASSPEGMEIGNEVLNAECKLMDFGIHRFHDGRPLMLDAENINPSKGEGVNEDYANLACEIKSLKQKIESRIIFYESLCNELDDYELALESSFKTEYDMGMFNEGFLYQGKFLHKSKHWTFSEARKTMKSSYDKCMEYFKKLTVGLNTHNARIFSFSDGSRAGFSFTVDGVPGDFEITIPLIPEYGRNKVDFHGTKKPMQMSLVWRRASRWMIPVFDYFFDGFGSYYADDIAAELVKFVETEKWKEFCPWMFDKENFVKKIVSDGNEVPTEESFKILERLLKDEIEYCSKEQPFTEE